MTFKFITNIGGFDFYDACIGGNESNYHELWIMNKEITKMNFVYGNTGNIEIETIKNLYAKNYFDSYMYNPYFTDQED